MQSLQNTNTGKPFCTKASKDQSTATLHAEIVKILCHPGPIGGKFNASILDVAASRVGAVITGTAAIRVHRADGTSALRLISSVTVDAGRDVLSLTIVVAPDAAVSRGFVVVSDGGLGLVVSVEGVGVGTGVAHAVQLGGGDGGGGRRGDDDLNRLRIGIGGIVGNDGHWLLLLLLLLSSHLVLPTQQRDMYVCEQYNISQIIERYAKHIRIFICKAFILQLFHVPF